MPTQYLVLDIGTSATKAALYENGTFTNEVTATYSGDPLLDPMEWVKTASEAINTIQGNSSIQNIILTGRMQDLILLDADGQLVRDVIPYNDTRAHIEAAEIAELWPIAEQIEVTGNPQDAGSLLAKLRWLQKNEPDTLEKAQYLLMGAADYVASKLVGEYVNDVTTASTTGLIDLRTRQPLGKDILEKIDLAPIGSLMSKITRGGTHLGNSSDAAKIFLAPGDAGSATIGAGSGDIGTAYAYIGTSGWVAFTSASPAEPNRGVITLAHPQPDRFIQVAPLMTASGNLDWVAGLLGESDYDALIGSAIAQPSTNLIYLPYLNGERSPFSNPFARGTFIGLDANTDKLAMSRAVLEGIAFAYRHVLEALIPNGIKTFMLTGGGSQSVAFCQLIADITGVTVTVADDAANVGLRGAVRSVEVMLGEASTYQISDLPISTTLHPQAMNRAFYDRKYAIFRAAYLNLVTTFADLAQLDTDS